MFDERTKEYSSDILCTHKDVDEFRKKYRVIRIVTFPISILFNIASKIKDKIHPLENYEDTL